MPVIDESIIINRPRADVYAFAADSGNLLECSSNLVEYEEYRAGPVQADTTAKGITRVAGRNVEWTSKVTNLDEGAAITYQSVESPMAFTYSYRFADAEGSGTTVMFHQDIPTIGGFFGKLTDPIVTRMYSRNVLTNLANLKELLEA